MYRISSRMHSARRGRSKRRAVVLLLFGFAAACCAQTGGRAHPFLEKRLDRSARENSGPEPDYSQWSFWAASPYRHNTSDSIPAFLKNEIGDKRADVFFIHPTSYTADLKNASWNADLDDEDLNKRTDERTILFQASVFNGSCRIFAPRYRQAHLKAFLVRNSERAQQAFDLAYGDIRQAFRYYLDHENHGRPIVIASHSQGSMHAVRLLKEFFDGTELQKLLVCAYVVGYPIDSGTFHSIPVGTTPEATGCVVGWCTYQKDRDPRYLQAPGGNGICVNPLTWSMSADEAPRELHRGAVFRDFNTLYPHIAGASIDPEYHVLRVTLPEELRERLHDAANLHIIDYNLFWMDIRENVKTRIDAYLARHPG